MTTIQMTIDEDLLRQLDQVIKETNTTRSAFIRESLWMVSAAKKPNFAVALAPIRSLFLPLLLFQFGNQVSRIFRVDVKIVEANDSSFIDNDDPGCTPGAVISHEFGAFLA
ncbi:CopG family transcriptional regulator [candidate division KSB1 bacterium]|nr:CopG family transcriptional regulator [candidate division KSB1 bacterium]NIR70310.1 CopG family transcriptional regulator [candidate division KSB1 bacterium]NIS27614.1 CopG family transcriptional regulator [candidate division KSB1 bacterium]NIT74454.1 CopG family transcriptional regulator [candidate division KSB1 bacterium]NIU28979.1 CopG family transcriptional regulator [candidate division KSB1 bacterium]